MNHNFVIFWSDWDLYKQSYADVMNLPNVRYISSPLQFISGYKRNIYDLQHSDCRFVRRFGRILGGDLHYKQYSWYESYFRDDFKDDKPLVFIFNRDWVLNEFSAFPLWLKQRYPKSHLVYFSCDLFQHNEKLGMDVNKIKSDFDLILSFDQNDCETYGFTYHPLVFSKYQGNLENMPYHDVYFLGQPKDRMSEIISCIEKLWAYGVSTDIHLINVPERERVYEDKIHYSEMVEYQENLQFFMHSNCALELMQHGGAGYTQRMCEAIAFDKKIITNNALIHEAPFYNPEYIFQIKSAEDITSELCQRIKKEEKVNYYYKEKISPVELLDFIEKKLMVTNIKSAHDLDSHNVIKKEVIKRCFLTL